MTAAPDLDYTALRAAAEKATPGPWYARPNYLIGGTWITTDPENNRDRAVADLIDSDANADFIAAANPATVLALLDRIEALERVAEAAQFVVNAFSEDDEPHLDDSQSERLVDLLQALADLGAPKAPGQQGEGNKP